MFPLADDIRHSLFFAPTADAPYTASKSPPAWRNVFVIAQLFAAASASYANPASESSGVVFSGRVNPCLTHSRPTSRTAAPEVFRRKHAATLGRAERIGRAVQEQEVEPAPCPNPLGRLSEVGRDSRGTRPPPAAAPGPKPPGPKPPSRPSRTRCHTSRRSRKPAVARASPRTLLVSSSRVSDRSAASAPKSARRARLYRTRTSRRQTHPARTPRSPSRECVAAGVHEHLLRADRRVRDEHAG